MDSDLAARPDSEFRIALIERECRHSVPKQILSIRQDRWCRMDFQVMSVTGLIGQVPGSQPGLIVSHGDRFVARIRSNMGNAVLHGRRRKLRNEGDYPRLLSGENDQVGERCPGAERTTDRTHGVQNIEWELPLSD